MNIFKSFLTIGCIGLVSLTAKVEAQTISYTPVPLFVNPTYIGSLPLPVPSTFANLTNQTVITTSNTVTSLPTLPTQGATAYNILVGATGNFAPQTTNTCGFNIWSKDGIKTTTFPITGTFLQASNGTVYAEIPVTQAQMAGAAGLSFDELITGGTNVTVTTCRLLYNPY